jgi:hypothetical protein
MEDGGEARASPPIFVMSAIKDCRLPITLDKERYLYFSLTVMDEMQDKFGGYNMLGEAMQGKEALKNVAWILARLINEGEILTRYLETGEMDGAPKVDERITMLLLNPQNINEVKTAIFSAFNMGTVGTPEAADADEEDEDEDLDNNEDEEKNSTGGQG